MGLRLLKLPLKKCHSHNVPEAIESPQEFSNTNHEAKSGSHLQGRTGPPSGPGTKAPIPRVRMNVTLSTSQLSGHCGSLPRV